MPKAAEIVDLASIAVGCLKQLRDNSTDDQWDVFCDNEHLDELLCSIMDLESSIDEE